jgi:preprotein translocase subunit SecY
MASAAEQMAANLSWSTLGKATDLRQRIFFTLGLLIVYRVGTYIPVPGIDGAALREFVEQASSGLGGMLNMFTGGAIGRMGIFALGIMPYISASIIVQLLAAMVPALEQLKKEGEQGRRSSTSIPATARCCWQPFRPMVWPSAWKRAIWSPTPAGSSAPPA